MTLGVGTVIQGVFLIYTKGAPKGNASPLLKAICGQSFIGILSGIVVIWAVMAAVTIVLLRNTPYGRKIYSVGTNEQAARFSGIHTGRGDIFRVSDIRGYSSCLRFLPGGIHGYQLPGCGHQLQYKDHSGRHHRRNRHYRRKGRIYRNHSRGNHHDHTG